MYVTDRHDMTLAVKVALNLNTTNQPTIFFFTHFLLVQAPFYLVIKSVVGQNRFLWIYNFVMVFFVLCITVNVFNPLPDDKILDWSKFKQTADNILKCI